MKVYQVNDFWKWERSYGNPDYVSGTKTLGIFASVEVAEKFIRQCRQVSENDGEITFDNCIREGIETARYIEVDLGYHGTECHEITMIELEVIEKLE